VTWDQWYMEIYVNTTLFTRGSILFFLWASLCFWLVQGIKKKRNLGQNKFIGWRIYTYIKTKLCTSKAVLTVVLPSIIILGVIIDPWLLSVFTIITGILPELEQCITIDKVGLCWKGKKKKEVVVVSFHHKLNLSI